MAALSRSGGVSEMVSFSTSDLRDSMTGKLLLVNWTLIAAVAGIACIGTAALYSVAGGSFQPWAERHAMRFLLTLALALAIAVTRPQLLMQLAYPAYAIALGLLLLVPFTGNEALGARRWLSLGGVSIQPSEFMKLALVLALARYYQTVPSKSVSHPKALILPLLMIAGPVMLTLRQPDLGSAMLFMALGLSLMFLAGVSSWYYAGAAALGIAVAPLIWNALHDYQRRRVEVFLNPDTDPLGAGYHIAQSRIALGSGGVSGKGYLQGTQSQLDFVPEKHTDFIATMIGEEWGFVGLMLVIGLFALVLFSLGVMAWRCRHRFGRMLIAGSAVTIFSYVAINLGMVTGLVPVVGIPLPLISYGGTSMTTIMLGLGLALSADVHGRDSRMGL
jgi:rod shape determining protein RodA